MRKRLTAALLCLCMLFTLFPVTAFAGGKPDGGMLPAQSVSENTATPSNASTPSDARAGGEMVYVGGVELSRTTDSPAYAATDTSGKVITE